MKNKIENLKVCKKKKTKNMKNYHQNMVMVGLSPFNPFKTGVTFKEVVLNNQISSMP